MANEKIEIEIVLDDGSISKGFASIKKEATQVGDKISKSFSQRGASFLNKDINILSNGFAKLSGAIAGALTVYASFATIRSAVEAAKEQQQAITNLNTSLALAGDFSESASQSFQDLAKELQATSTFGDEVILSQAAIARNFTKTNEEAKKLTKAAVDLSAATGLSLESSVKNLGKTFSGLTGELGESIPALKNFTQAQLKSGAALDLVINRFGGAAAGQVKTFSGAIAQLSNTFSDFLQSIGDIIIRSPVVVKLINELANTFSTAGDSISKISITKDIIGDIIRSFITFSIGVNDLIIRPLEILTNVINIPFRIAVTSINGLIAALGQVGGKLGEFISFFKPDSEIAQGLKTFASSSKEVFLNSFGEIDKAVSGVFDTGLSDGVGKFLNTVDQLANSVDSKLLPAAASIKNGIKTTVAEVDKELEKLRDQVFRLQADSIKAIGNSFYNPDVAFAGNPNIFKALGTSSKEELESLKQSLTQFTNETIANAKKINEAITNGLARSISAGVQASIQSLIKGKNAFQAFGKAVLGVFGDLAIQLGEFFIIQGIAVESLKSLGGAAAIAAGVALVALGSLLKSISGGEGISTSPGGVTSPALANTDGTNPATAQQQEQRTAVSVVVQGNVFDSEETGLRIADILKDQFGSKGVVLA